MSTAAGRGKRRGKKATAPQETISTETRSLNVQVLQRLDPNVTAILLTAAHVTAYDFDLATGAWVRSPKQGTSGFKIVSERNIHYVPEGLARDASSETRT